jgi:hypothetical protein
MGAPAFAFFTRLNFGCPGVSWPHVEDVLPFAANTNARLNAGRLS